MTSLYRYRLNVRNFPGGPGVCTFYSLDNATFRTNLAGLCVAVGNGMPTGTVIETQTTGDIIEDTTGAITGAWSNTAVEDAGLGTQDGNYAAGVGAIMAWDTGTILDGRRVRGHNFIVPLAATCYQSDGTLNATYIGAIQTAMTAFITAESASFVIWHRPRKAKAADGSRKAVTARDGGHALVVSGHVPDHVCVLKTRRY